MLIAPLYSPSETTEATRLVNPVELNAVTKSSASPNVDPSPDAIVTVLAVSNAS